jgi:hypothetical protein
LLATPEIARAASDTLPAVPSPLPIDLRFDKLRLSSSATDHQSALDTSFAIAIGPLSLERLMFARSAPSAVRARVAHGDGLRNDGGPMRNRQLMRSETCTVVPSDSDLPAKFVGLVVARTSVADAAGNVLVRGLEHRHVARDHVLMVSGTRCRRDAHSSSGVAELADRSPSGNSTRVHAEQAKHGRLASLGVRTEY